MLTTVEKVIALKKAEVFGDVPDQVLAELTPYVEEVEYGAGQAIFQKGDRGDFMFVVVDGRVRIHDGPRTLFELSAGQPFGEMAALDAEPRLVSATAVVDSLLLRLDQESLYEVIGGPTGVAAGLIRALCKRARTRLREFRQKQLQAERAGE
jgi:CRP-like cAMP-binding protein